MKSLMTFLILTLTAFAALAQPRDCSAMDDAASAIAKINGALYASPSYRVPEVPNVTPLGEEYSYQFDALYSTGDEAPLQKVGTIKVTALRKKGESLCKILTVSYSETL